MRIFNATLAIVLGLALAPAAALAQNSASSVPPPNPKASITGTAPAASSGQGANNSAPVGGPGIVAKPHAKTHKRKHKKLNGKHYNYVRGGTKKGPGAVHHKVTGTTSN
ncbi:hypothetical protein [Acidisoma sp. C75]